MRDEDIRWLPRTEELRTKIIHKTNTR